MLLRVNEKKVGVEKCGRYGINPSAGIRAC